MRRRSLEVAGSITLLVVSVVLGCGGQTDSSAGEAGAAGSSVAAGSGGVSAAGGTQATGGSPSAAGSGGSTSGGASGSAGTSPTGGAAGTSGTGATGGTGGTGGTTVGCVLPSDCPGGDTPCSFRQCVNGQCLVSFVPAGDAMSQVSKDCKRLLCDGASNVQQVVDDSDLPFDGKQCTSDVCSKGVASNPPLALGSACNENGGSKCDGGGNCVGCISNAECGDGSYCNGAETCQNGVCTAGTPIVCAGDGFSCTSEVCVETTESCGIVKNDVACTDSLTCNGKEACDPTASPIGSVSGCAPGTPVNCSDGVACTADACSEAPLGCTHAPNPSSCDDGVYCTLDGCDPSSTGTGCKHAPRVCPNTDGIACTVESCSESSDTCQSTPSHAACPAGELCVAGSGCAVVSCTVDASCSDGNACNGAETCAGGKCMAGSPVSCNDGIGCTADTCDPASGACTPFADDLACSDGQLCNGDERCVPGVGCQAGPPHVCTNDVACVTPVCDAASDACKPIPNDGLCPCGQSCDAKLGCTTSCSVKTCQGKVFACGDCTDNDGDCAVDMKDAHCTGPCDNSEQKFFVDMPSQCNAGPCKQDCYFDADCGAGNDDCNWDHRCDPNEPEKLDGCLYTPGFVFPGSKSCSYYQGWQSSTCLGYCLPLTPNGCDCFGCCQIPAPSSSGSVTVWIGSRPTMGSPGTCDSSSLTDPTKCAPCIQTPGCINPCETCELCIGKSQLPPSCTIQSCPAGAQACGLPGQAPCPSDQFCNTGCCRPNPS